MAPAIPYTGAAIRRFFEEEFAVQFVFPFRPADDRIETVTPQPLDGFSDGAATFCTNLAFGVAFQSDREGGLEGSPMSRSR